MYTVIDEPAVMASTRQQAEQLQADLCRDNPACDWKIFKQVEDDDGKLERLYALAALLLQGTNPVGIQLVIAQLDGSEETVSAVQIMNDARRVLDSMEDW